MSIGQQGMEIAMRAAVAAGRELTNQFDLEFRVQNKESLRDIVVDADRAAEERAIAVVSASEIVASILSEESGRLGDPTAEYQWIIDALDGTVNYVHHIPFYSVSVALYRGLVPIAGAVYAPVPNELYYAARGVGAFKNDRRIGIVDQSFRSSLFAAAFSGSGPRDSARNEEFRLFQTVNDSSRGCLRTGSAALNLAYVAEGRLNGCWGRANKIWDVAAGLIIAREAGGIVWSETVSGSAEHINYSAGTPRNASDLAAIIAKSFSADERASNVP